MAQPIIKSCVQKKVFDKNNIYVYDINAQKLDLFCNDTGVKKAESENFIAKNCDIVMLCTKPQSFPEVLSAIKDTLKNSNALIVSIAAGKTTEWIKSALEYNAKIARIFPNLNATVGEAVSAYTGNELASEDELCVVGEICRSFGEAIQLNEEQFSSFGVLGGCSPAYVFMFIGALAKAAQAHGIDSETARKAAVQSVLGSATLLKECAGSIDEWIDRVCSKGGTTIKGVESLRSSGLDNIVNAAFGESYKRDLELSGK